MESQQRSVATSTLEDLTTWFDLKGTLEERHADNLNIERDLALQTAGYHCVHVLDSDLIFDYLNPSSADANHSYLITQFLDNSRMPFSVLPAAFIEISNHVASRLGLGQIWDDPSLVRNGKNWESIQSIASSARSSLQDFTTNEPHGNRTRAFAKRIERLNRHLGTRRYVAVPEVIVRYHEERSLLQTRYEEMTHLLNSVRSAAQARNMIDAFSWLSVTEANLDSERERFRIQATDMPARYSDRPRWYLPVSNTRHLDALVRDYPIDLADRDSSRRDKKGRVQIAGRNIQFLTTLRILSNRGAMNGNELNERFEWISDSYRHARRTLRRAGIGGDIRIRVSSHDMSTDFNIAEKLRTLPDTRLQRTAQHLRNPLITEIESEHARDIWYKHSRSILLAKHDIAQVRYEEKDPRDIEAYADAVEYLIHQDSDALSNTEAVNVRRLASALQYFDCELRCVHIGAEIHLEFHRVITTIYNQDAAEVDPNELPALRPLLTLTQADDDDRIITWEIGGGGFDFISHRFPDAFSPPPRLVVERDLLYWEFDRHNRVVFNLFGGQTRVVHIRAMLNPAFEQLTGLSLAISQSMKGELPPRIVERTISTFLSDPNEFCHALH